MKTIRCGSGTLTCMIAITFILMYVRALPTGTNPSITETCEAAPAGFKEKLLKAKREDCEIIASECKSAAASEGISETNCEDCKRKCLNPSPEIKPTESCEAAPRKYRDKLLKAKREECETLAAECKIVASSEGISETNCEDCKRTCLNKPSETKVTESCEAAPETYKYKLLHAKRDDCETLATECKKAASSEGISDTNCEDCKRKCLNKPSESKIKESCESAPGNYKYKLLHAKREDCETLATECKRAANSEGISDTNCEDCKRKCLNKPSEPKIRESCESAPGNYKYKLLHAKREDCETLATECKKAANSEGISETNCEDCKRKCLNKPSEPKITESCEGAPRNYKYKLLHAKREDCETLAVECETAANLEGISVSNCEDCKRKCLNQPSQPKTT